MKCKKGKELMIIVNLFIKIGLFDGFSCCGNLDEKILFVLGIN